MSVDPAPGTMRTWQASLKVDLYGSTALGLCIKDLDTYKNQIDRILLIKFISTCLEEYFLYIFLLHGRKMKPPYKLKGVLEGLLLIKYKQLLKYWYYMNLTTTTTRQPESMQIFPVLRHIDNLRKHQVLMVRLGAITSTILGFLWVILAGSFPAEEVGAWGS